MRTRHVTFFSDGIRLEGLLQLPDEHEPDRCLPVVLLCSGFQGLKELIPAKLWGQFLAAGYACLAFDYRGFGTSEGQRGRMLPDEQIEDVRNAITFVQQQPEIDPLKIGLVGWGFGGGIVVQAAAEDQRVCAVACLNGIGDGGRTVRDSFRYADWLTIQDRIAADEIRRVTTGHSELVSPWDVVPLDPLTMENVQEDMYGNHERFGVDVSLQSAAAYYAFRPERAIHDISPRPLLIVHGARNALHPIDEARSLYAHACEPKQLIEIPDGHHLDWIQPDSPMYQTVIPRIIAWFQEQIPPGSMEQQGAPLHRGKHGSTPGKAAR